MFYFIVFFFLLFLIIPIAGFIQGFSYKKNSYSDYVDSARWTDGK